jgi:hypothetical protein
VKSPEIALFSDITVVICTSPRPSHPSAEIILKTIASVRKSLPDSRIIITCDGPDDAPNYLPFKMQLKDYAVLHFMEHVHQSGMLKRALDWVETPIMFYCEDDWEILPDIPWHELSRLMLTGKFNYIKLHATPRISPFHEHLMEERVIYQNEKPYDRYQDAIGGKAIPIIKTRQWSQNPHLGWVDFYKRKILPMVKDKKDYLENIIHGVAANSHWDDFRCGIYNPPDGDMMRIRHLDGRGAK